MKNKNKVNFINLPNEDVKQILIDNYYQKSMQNADSIDVDINHLENIFTNETYYLPMKIVPLIERKVLYLSYVENVKLNDICRKLKLERKEVISLRNKGIKHFKYNLNTLYKAENIKNILLPKLKIIIQ